MVDYQPVFFSGTSPRLWGDSYDLPDLSPAVRYIPTLVGRLVSVSVSGPLISVHPHACGEIFCEVSADFCQFGTSPRLWGDLCRACPSLFPSRYIPTLVGRLDTNGHRPQARTVHPHACGEIHRTYLSIISIDGTSPRLWGDYRSGRMVFALPRYIPTLVGRLQTLTDTTPQ